MSYAAHLGGWSCGVVLGIVLLRDLTVQPYSVTGVSWCHVGIMMLLLRDLKAQGQSWASVPR